MQIWSTLGQDTSLPRQSAVRTYYALLGLEVLDIKEKQMQMLIKGLKKTMPHITKQAAPITPDTLMILSKVVNCNDQIELLAWAACFYTKVA